MNVKVYEVMRMAVEQGVARGHNRAYERAHNPTPMQLNESITDAVMLSVADWFHFPFNIPEPEAQPVEAAHQMPQASGSKSVNDMLGRMNPFQLADEHGGRILYDSLILRNNETGGILVELHWNGCLVATIPVGGVQFTTRECVALNGFEGSVQFNLNPM